MNKIIIILVFSFFTVCGNSQNTKTTKNQMETKNHKYTNNLINENSPYLLQHAHNPVN